MLKSVYELIEPIAKPIAKKRLQEQEKQITIYERLKIASVMALLKIVTFYKYITDKDYRQDCIEAGKARKLLYSIEDDAEMFSHLLVAEWIQTLLLTARSSGKLSISSLDDSMLPASGQLAEYGKLSQFFNLQVFTMEDVHKILCIAKTSLPKGHSLPEALIEYFKLSNISVVP